MRRTLSEVELLLENLIKRWNRHAVLIIMTHTLCIRTCKNAQRIQVLRMRILRSVLGVFRRYWLMNDSIRNVLEIYNLNIRISDSTDHVQWIYQYRLPKKLILLSWKNDNIEARKRDNQIKCTRNSNAKAWRREKNQVK